MSLTAAMRMSGAEQRSRFRLGKWIVTGQVALSLVLLVGGGLLLRTFLKLETLDVGFDRSNVLVVLAKAPWFAKDTNRMTPELHETTYNEIGRRLRALPGVVSVTRSFTTPMGDDNWAQQIYLDSPNAPTGDDAQIWLNFVSPGYFATLRTPLHAGRDFTEEDTRNSPRVAIINETAANRFFSGKNPVGQHFRWGDETGIVDVVGVVKDSKYQSMRKVTPATVFIPATQMPARENAEEFVLRTAVPPATLFAAIQKSIGDLNQRIPLEFHTLSELVDDQLVRERLLATLAGFFSGLSLLLAMIGLYGVLSYLVTQRQAEFGIRLALGAQPDSILRLVMWDVLTVLIVGITAGITIALLSVTLLQKLLFGLAPRDTLTMVTSVCVLSAMALLAGYLPARRATRVDPMTALRCE
jgi:predicted permease